MELIVHQPGDGSADAGFSLEALDFEDLTFDFGLGTSWKVFANAFTVQPAGNAINDLPGGIREL